MTNIINFVTRVTVCAAILLFFSDCKTVEKKEFKNQVIDVSFKRSAQVESDPARTLQSLIKIRDISEQYATGGVYLITHYGNRDSLFETENHLAVTQPMIKEPWRFCSMFSVKNQKGMIMGRNWDNQNVGSILVSYYKPHNGYASVNFARAIDIDFPMNVDLLDMVETPFANALLLAPFYTYDGMNETGLCIGVTGLGTVPIEAPDSANLVFIGYLTRLVLDQTSSVTEAIQLIKNYIPFDLDKNMISAHFFIADAAGNSAVLEFIDNEWKVTKNESSWQVMTNKVISDVPDSVLREKCWRYQSISETLYISAERVEWSKGMQILRDVSQSGTTWSVVYSLTGKEMYFSAYQDWSRVYHLFPFNTPNP